MLHVLGMNYFLIVPIPSTCTMWLELSRKKIGSSGIEVKTKNEKINFSIMTLNLVLLCYFAKDGKEIYQICNACAVYCFCHEMN